MANTRTAIKTTIAIVSAQLIMAGGVLMAGHIGISGTAYADTTTGSVMRCTVTVVDGQTYLDDCDYYTDSEQS